MKITSIRFRRLQSHDRGYGHDAVEAEATVSEGEAPEQAMADLKLWVMEQLGRVREVDKLVEAAQRLREDVTRYERDRDRLKKEVDVYRKVVRESDKLHALAKAAGLTEEAEMLFNADEIPF